MAKHIRIIPARRVRRPHITSRLPHIAERPAIPRQAWQGSRAQHPASALSAASAESPCEKARLPCKKSRVCERFHPHSMERSNQRPGNSRRHTAFLRSKTAENGARIVHNPGFFAQESEKPLRAGRRTLQSGTRILFQGEVKFLTGGDPAEGPCRDAWRSACGGPSHGRQSATPRLSAAAIDAGPVLDGRARSAEIRRLTPVGTRDQRSQSGWKRQRSAMKRELTASWRWMPTGANRHGAASCAQDLRTPRACMERNPYGLVFFCRPEDAPPIEDLRERGSP